MDILLALAATVPVLVVAAVVLLTARAVRGDGYGHRPPPASHEDWTAGHLPSRGHRG